MRLHEVVRSHVVPGVVGSFLLMGALVGCSASPATSPDVQAVPPTEVVVATVAPKEEPLSPTEAPAPSATAEPAPAPTEGAAPPSDAPPPAEGAIPFERLAQGESLAAGVGAGTLMVADSAEEVEQIVAMVGDEGIASQLRAADLQGVMVVALFRGEEISSGYGVTIQEISQGADAVQLTAALSAPGADQMVSDMISYPYDIVLIPTGAASLAPGTAWRAHTTDDTVLAELTLP